jgi:hypothetical protein
MPYDISLMEVLISKTKKIIKQCPLVFFFFFFFFFFVLSHWQEEGTKGRSTPFFSHQSGGGWGVVCQHFKKLFKIEM